MLKDKKLKLDRLIYKGCFRNVLFKCGKSLIIYKGCFRTFNVLFKW